jgi:S-DNA-T family DNA segregation ATPase FtsK/SpoIIIE
MPILKPTLPPRKKNKPAAKTIPPKKGTILRGNTGTARGREVSAHVPAFVPEPSWWERLSPERKLDVVGILIALLGLLLLLGLVFTDRSAWIGSAIFFLLRIFGWGIYALSICLFLFGLWLILRKIERLPRLTLERAVGSTILFLWLLTLMHSVVSTAETAEAVALHGVGGGALGGLFLRLLWNGVGGVGLVISMMAWLVIGLAVTLDMPVTDLFRWLSPVFTRIRTWMNRPVRAQADSQIGSDKRPGSAAVSTDGLTPIDSASIAQPKIVPVNPNLQTAAPHALIQWSLPDLRDVLDEGNAPAINDDFVQQRARLIEDTLASFGAPAQVVAISRGPTITQFGVEPLFIESRGGKTRVRVSKIASLSDDLALALAAPRIRIQAPVPGHSYVGIEVPNEEMAMVALREILESDSFKRNRRELSFALGRDVAGHPILANLEGMPHLLIAGTTGSGKSVCVNSILTCLLLHNTPDDLRLVLVDPKRVELTGYNGIPHLLGPVVVEMERVIGALQWMTREMDKRYHLFAQSGARNIADYNARMKLQNQKKLPYLVIVIDELADLMMIAPDETERTITRLAQLARATGIHMVLATQRPSVDVVTGLIKANFPARIAFAVASNTDSRVILDQPGAERLLGRGDMLYQAPDSPSPARLQGVFVSDHEIQKLVEYWRTLAGGASLYAVAGAPVDSAPLNIPLKQAPLWEEMKQTDGDPLFDEAVAIIRKEGRASVSMLQRRLRIGYTRASRIIDQMEDKGVVGPPVGGTQMRQVLDFGPTGSPQDHNK